MIVSLVIKKSRCWINTKESLLVLLGMLTAFGPFVTDMYLPSLPSMAQYFHTSSSLVQLGLTTSMIGLAVGQIIFGPISDRYGRRPLLVSAMLLFVVSTILCLFSPTIYIFVALRLIQGIAGAGGIVISRSVATDRFNGKDLTKVLAIIGAINGVAPVMAPVLGGLLTDSVGWKGIFLVLLLLGCILLVGSILFQETLPFSERSDVKLVDTFRSFNVIIRNPMYICFVLQMAFAQGVLFGNIASSPFIIQQHYGFSPFSFSVIFGINALAIGIAAALSAKFKTPEKGTFIGCIGMCLFSILECVALFTNSAFWIYETLLFLLLFFMGMTFTTSTALAMESERHNAGAASALLGAVCFAIGGLVSPIVGLGNIMSSTGIVFVVSSFCSLSCVLFYFRQKNVRKA